jgi:peptidoglycan/xylan/chitin deacetylase (PgdA/CDA1 family)
MTTPNVPPRIEIARFPGNKRFAVTTSWDDGTVEDRPLVAWMNEHGLKGTFNLNSGTLLRTGTKATKDEGRIDASEVAELYAGHEVAIHTVSHPHLPLLDPSQVAYEVLDDRRALEDLVGYPVRGMAYPFGTYSQQVIDVLRSIGIVYCRTTEQLDACFPPKEPLAWGTTAHMYTEKDGLDIGQRFLKLYENPRSRGVYFVWGHAFEFMRDYNRVVRDRWAELDKRFKPLTGHADVWYCTNIELFEYEAARQRMVIAANRKTAYNPSAIPVTLVMGTTTVDVPPGQLVTLA